MKPHEELLEIRRKTVHLITGALVAALAWTRFFDSVLMLSITFF
jgi:hypothetical protein